MLLGALFWMSPRASADALPPYRATMRIASDVGTVLAVLEDVDQACAWTAHCAEMRKVRTHSAQVIDVYARMDAPWPVRDRDVVTRVRVEPLSESLIVANIERFEDPEVPPLQGVVRMPAMRAAYQLRVLSANEVEVTYDVQVDPGGTLPGWLTALVSRDLARETLTHLADRVVWAKGQGIYADRAASLVRDMLKLARARGKADEEPT
jgi:hypothetical protein